MTESTDPLAAFAFDLPEERIALRPVQPREAARLLVVHADGRLDDRYVRDLPDLLSAGDALVFNETRVVPAALQGHRPARDQAGQDVRVDVNLVRRHSVSEWWALARPGRRLKAGDRLNFASDFSAEIRHKTDNGDLLLAFDRAGIQLDQAIDTYGAMPLPPYIARRRAADVEDRETYQTQFAGPDAQSVAAPTAGLHFSPDLLRAISSAGLIQARICLHVGLGTFAPLTEDQLRHRRLHAEWCEVSEETASQLNAVRAAGHRCVAVGTTALRTLESAVSPGGQIRALSGETNIFIQPGDPVRSVDGLMTNFHLPRSSLFMLVCALMGTDCMQAAYAHAIENEYRFYSYGDACLLLP